MAGPRWLPSWAASNGRSVAERDLAVARRLGHWFTEEDRQLLREHQAQLALAQRAEAVRQVARVSTTGLLVAAWAIPPLWPVALVASFRVFPRTSRRVLVTGLALTSATVVGSGVVVHQLVRSISDPSPAAPTLVQPQAPAAQPLARP